MSRRVSPRRSTKRRSTRRTGFGGGFGRNFMDIAVAGILYGLAKKIISDMLGKTGIMAGLGRLGLPIAIYFINDRFFKNSHIGTLAIFEIAQTLTEKILPDFKFSGDDGYEVGQIPSYDVGQAQVTQQDIINMMQSGDLSPEEGQALLDVSTVLAGDSGYDNPNDWTIS